MVCLLGAKNLFEIKRNPSRDEDGKPRVLLLKDSPVARFDIIKVTRRKEGLK